MPRQTETPKVPPSRPVGFLEAGQSLPTIPPPSPALGRQYSRRPPGRKRGPAKPAHRRQPGGGKITALTREARDEQSVAQYKQGGETSVCENCSASLARLASKSLAPTTFWRWNGRRPRGLATLRRLRTTAKTTEHHLDRCLRVETAVANMAAEIRGRHRQDGHPQQVGGLRKTLEIADDLCGGCKANCKRPRSRKFLAQRSPPTPYRLVPMRQPHQRPGGQSHQEVVDARKWGGVDRVRKARNQKVVLTCACPMPRASRRALKLNPKISKCPNRSHRYHLSLYGMS
ncbi:hypothetical protein EVAR_90446_1 [Eumeta japonica]|uniref:Uncharacterized protein n=1 Tax=Eumeta variegata TaxID=151549 RepID=A0A4C1SHZ5_EUMVA|nr:hypothetical protein EVAR_90446_1 [Eumeta japonica]